MNTTSLSHAAPRVFTTFTGILPLVLTSAQTASAQTNTNTGTNAGISITTGTQNAADGYYALHLNTTGSRHIAVGSISLQANIAGSYNTAVGYGALATNLAAYNTALGYETLYTNKSGASDVAVGYVALYANTTGGLNTALGDGAMRYNQTGASNLAAGYEALYKNVSGGFNVALGDGALLNSTGSSNIAVGEDAGYNLTTGSNNISIGNKGLAGESGVIRIGTTGIQTDTYLTGVIRGNGSGLTGITGASLTAGSIGNTQLGTSLTIGGDGSDYGLVANAAGGLGGILANGGTFGYGLQGTTTSAIGVWGSSGGAGDGVYGSSSTGYGVHALSTSGDAVHGVSTSASGVFCGSTTGVGVYGYSSSYDAGYFDGNVALSTRGDEYFGSQIRQMLNLWGTEQGVSTQQGTDYGIGVQNFSLCFRTENGGSFAWYSGGAHADNKFDAGERGLQPGTTLMTLDILTPSGAGVAGSYGLLTVGALTILGGSDLAEPFKMTRKNRPTGSVVIIDENNPGALKPSERAYDRRAAGIVSGANGVNPGISLRQDGVMEGDQNIALSGRVYVTADASNGAIRPGNLLTTSDTPGRAMKATEYTRAQGAVIGKAMGSLNDGEGLVLVLVTLQ